MLSELHQVLLGCGFQYTKARHIPEGTPLCLLDVAKGFYVKSYGTTGGEFSIALSLPIDPHITLPNAYILKKPDQYKNRLLPHVNLGWYLCYVREMEADWDANNLQELYLQVDCQIQTTLNASVTSANQGSPDDREMEGEFSSYWLPQKKLYLLSDASEKLEMECYVTLNESGLANPGKASGEEWVAYEKGDESEFNEWLRQRCLTKQDGRTILTSYFKINPSRLAGVVWPPQNLRALLQWLTEVDLSARSRLLDHFVNNPVKRHVLLFDVRHQDLVGLFVELDIAATGLNTYPQKNNRKKRTGRVVKSKTLITCLSAKRSVHKFSRLEVTRADRKTILSRNRRRSATGDLSTKRIALLGCGTIGGYLCGLLLRSGAGCGNARFDLYDDDSFGPQNFGRHPLSTVDFGQNKAKALAATLKASTHLNCKVEGKPANFSITPEMLNQYDIVIDATGRPPVAKRLAHVVRTIPNNKRPKVVHGFNDGNGRSSKVMIDDGSCCYGCMLMDPAFYKNGLDLRFSKINTAEERFVSCGNTFTPYDAAVSVITAAMMQEAVLSILEPSLSWTYSEHMLDGSRSKQARLLPKQRTCPICHD
ncbi:ThiF family adenylyltransferase [Pseudomonas synxantha]|uniref:ThiF family adenylyltransferase n=1 Tax=Pseudomonas synxantha TaxID=47883 RepID=A0ABS0UHY9_9PSED|nr:E2/UBC family protein [Pseudomonas synxantha]MBI6565199.1 ThiF family adenylyltransferase [Pseudomonas synxantha]MBI6579913.1 ThiF family adenylyltransferase [Pseudomonas synxantha]MBI6646675.1 ThiF family adenylyltransferase [Pseudomonas synxantha]